MTDRPNVVWITIESTRYDHTSFATGGRETTPNMAQISERPAGVSYSGCFANGIWTRASMASMLTGTYVSHHRTGLTYNDRIPDEVPTVAELLSEAGYRTVCVPNTPNVSSASGLDRGFDEFFELDGSNPFFQLPPSIVARYVLGLNEHGGGWTFDGGRHSLDYPLTELFKRKLVGGGERPTFGFLHLKHPHHPYSPPPNYADRFLGDVPMDADEALATAHEMSDDIVDAIAAGCPFDDDQWAAIRSMYDATIRYADSLVGDLFDYVSDRLEDTVFVVTADHGELFGERGLLAHKLVTHDAVCNVPLVVHGPTALTEYDGPLIQHVDVVRTLLGELGANTDSLQGKDLTREPRDTCVVQRGGPRADRNLEKFTAANPSFDRSQYHVGLLTALRTTTYKYEHSDSGDRLYRLPGESTDVSDSEPERLAAFQDELVSFLDGPGQPATTDSQTVPLSDQMKRQLSDLGYLVD